MVGMHERVKIATGAEVYFCDPHSPWQRGTNENTNGLLREYFPKGMDLTTVTPKTSTTQPPDSTGACAKPSAGKPPHKPSNTFWKNQPHKDVLQL